MGSNVCGHSQPESDEVDMATQAEKDNKKGYPRSPWYGVGVEDLNDPKGPAFEDLKLPDQHVETPFEKAANKPLNTSPSLDLYGRPSKRSAKHK